MDTSDIRFTRPVLSGQDTLFFSAYGFGWGYRGFAVRVGTLRTAPNADCKTIDRLLRVSGADCQHLREVVLASEPALEGRRTWLQAADFEATH
jgi:hypothetical protein